MRPFIGITTGTAVNKDFPNAPIMVGQQHTYVDAIIRAGGVPLFIPIVKDYEVLKGLYDKCSGLLFAGGNDIDPARYGEKPEPTLGELDKDRDQQEFQLWDWSQRDNKPVLGICRGMQVINVALGGSLYQDIPTDLPDAGLHRVTKEESRKDDYHVLHHLLEVEPSSKLASIIGTKSIHTNAYHHQAVKKLGNGIKAVAWTDDGVIEGLEHPSKQFVIGVQSHPEAIEGKIETKWRKLFEAFIAAAS